MRVRTGGRKEREEEGRKEKRERKEKERKERKRKEKYEDFKVIFSYILWYF
jgi:hypothetical protein